MANDDDEGNAEFRNGVACRCLNLPQLLNALDAMARDEITSIAIFGIETSNTLLKRGGNVIGLLCRGWVGHGQWIIFIVI